MQDVIYRVFVSSTFEDLREERAEAQKALLKIKCFPIGMELFPSTDDETWEFIKRQIDESDYYIAIVAGRYGSTSTYDGLSFTEKEYDYAIATKKPALAFVHFNRNKIEASRSELDATKREKLDAFISKLKAHAHVNFYSSSHELGAQIIASMVDLKDRKPAIGFVKADQAVDYKKYADLLEENTALKKQVEQTKEGQLYEALNNQRAILLKFTVMPVNTHGQPLVAQSTSKEMHKTLADIFNYVAGAIITHSNIEQSIDNFLKSSFAEAPNGWRADWADSLTFSRLKVRLFGLGLIDIEIEGGIIRWRLTNEGQRQYGLLTANILDTKLEPTQNT
jgi:hypothetical protein